MYDISLSEGHATLIRCRKHKPLFKHNIIMHMENIVLYIHITLIYCIYQNEVAMYVTNHGLVLY